MAKTTSSSKERKPRAKSNKNFVINKARLLVLFVVCLLAGYVGIYTFFDNLISTMHYDKQVNTNGIIITTTKSNKYLQDNYKLLYSDPKLGKAIYLDLDYKAKVRSPQPVEIEGIGSGHIISSDGAKFIVKPDSGNKSITVITGNKILSKNKGKLLGIIFELNADGSISCISID